LFKVITDGFAFDGQAALKQPPVDRRIGLGKDLWIGPLGLETVNMVFDACGQRGLNFDCTRSLFSYYCFVREQNVAGTPSVAWYSDQQLRDCIALSRIVHPTTVSTYISARLSYPVGRIDTPSMIVPVAPQCMGYFAWVNDKNWRNWLTNDEAFELKGLIPHFHFES
jgi:hypothetical protein